MISESDHESGAVRPQNATMPLDAATVRNLELPALTALIDHTRTPIGARRLRAWLGAPMRDAESIELRLAAVDELVSSPTLRDRLGVVLKEVWVLALGGVE